MNFPPPQGLAKCFEGSWWIDFMVSSRQDLLKKILRSLNSTQWCMLLVAAAASFELHCLLACRLSREGSAFHESRLNHCTVTESASGKMSFLARRAEPASGLANKWIVAPST